MNALTPIELEVLRAAALGKSERATADQLVITVRAVRAHRLAVRRKLGNAPSIMHAAVRARRNGTLDEGPRFLSPSFFHLGGADELSAPPMRLSDLGLHVRDGRDADTRGGHA